MQIPTVQDLDVGGKRVLVRVDFNVPLRDGEITDDTRIQAALPTLRLLLERGAKLVLMSHLGRPKDEPDPKLSLEPVAARLAELLDGEVIHTDDCIGMGVRKVVSELREGGVVLLENTRFHAGEKKNDPGFAEKLAQAGEAFVSDAFGTAHRAHASNVGVARLLPQRAMGLLVQREVEAIGKLLEDPPRPFVAILGGAKVSDKIGVFDNLVRKVDAFVVGGAMANTFLAAQDRPVGTSLVERDKAWQARKILERCADRGVALTLPTDFVVSAAADGSAPSSTVATIPDDQMALDIGPDSVAAFTEIVSGAATVFWNGPMGLFEVSPFDAGTRGVAEALAASRAYSVVGGGDSAAALKQLGLADEVSHVSTGGGASMAFVAGEALPGLEVLEG